MTIKGNAENLEKFFSSIPAELSKTWHVEGINMGGQKNYMFYYRGGNSSGINILEVRKEAYNSYYVTAAGGYAFLASNALSAFKSDFSLWASACGVKIENN